MNVEMIKELIKAFKEAELTDLSLKCEEFELKLGKKSEKITAVIPSEMTGSRENMSILPTGNRPSSSSNSSHLVDDQYKESIASSRNDAGAGNENDEAQAESRQTKAIKAPIVGTFYQAGSPNGEPFVKVGSYVHKGDVVCVIEAMKLMNEVESEEEGEVVEILVQNEDMVEYNQPLIVLR